MVEGARLEREYTSKAYREFESLPVRQFSFLTDTASFSKKLNS